MKIHIIAPAGKKLQDTRTGNEYSEVICDEKKRGFYVLSDGIGEPTVETLADGVTYADKLNALEDELDAAKILLGVE